MMCNLGHLSWASVLLIKNIFQHHLSASMSRHYAVSNLPREIPRADEVKLHFATTTDRISANIRSSNISLLWHGIHRNMNDR